MGFLMYPGHGSRRPPSRPRSVGMRGLFDWIFGASSTRRQLYSLPTGRFEWVTNVSQGGDGRWTGDLTGEQISGVEGRRLIQTGQAELFKGYFTHGGANTWAYAAYGPSAGGMTSPMAYAARYQYTPDDPYAGVAMTNQASQDAMDSYRHQRYFDAGQSVYVPELGRSIVRRDSTNLVEGQALAPPDITDREASQLQELSKTASLSGIARQLLGYWKAYSKKGKTTYSAAYTSGSSREEGLLSRLASIFRSRSKTDQG